MNRLIWLWALSLLIKLGLAGFLPLSPDEAYYWVWTKHPQLSYFDHPPFVAWLMSWGSGLEGFYSFVRLPAVFLLHLSFWAWVYLFKDFLTADRIGIWALLWLLNPLTGLGSIVVTPDLPLMIFWPLALITLIRTIETRSKIWAIAFGLALGLGFCSKYHMALFGVLGLVWIVWERRFTRQHFLCLILSLLFFLVGSLPVWIWNWENQFISFKFQLQHGLGSSQWHFFWTWSYLLGQMMLLFPLVVWAMLKGFRQSSFPRWVKIFALGPLLFFFASSFRGKVEANWPIVAYPFVLALAAENFPRRQLKIALGLWAAIILFLVADLGFEVVPAKWTLSKSKEIKLIKLAERETKEYRPLFAHSYQMAAKMSFDLREDIYKWRGSGRYDFYDQLPGSLPGDRLFYFLTLKGETVPPADHDNYLLKERIPINDELDILKVLRQ